MKSPSALLPELAAVFSLAYERDHSIDLALEVVLRAPGVRAFVKTGRLRDDRPIMAVLREVCGYYGVTPKELLRRGDSACSRRRFVAAWCLREIEVSLPQSAIALGLDNHTSAYYGVHKVDDSPVLKAQGEEILRRFRAGRIGPARAPVEPLRAGGTA